MVEGWEWDATLFAGAAEHYARGRLPYAPGLAAAIGAALRLDGTGRLLDVGCGPGTVVLGAAALGVSGAAGSDGLVGWFDAAVGVDPDAGMIGAAARAARRAGVADRTRWECLRAEQLPGGLGTFDVVVFAQSFHWTDRARMASTVRGMLRPGGALVHIADRKGGAGLPGGLPAPVPPQDGIARLVREFLGPLRRAGQGVLRDGTPGGEAEILAAAGFRGPQRLLVPGGQVLERNEDDVVAGVLSMSFSAPHLFGPRLPEFESRLRALLRETSPGGRFAVRQPDTEVAIWRPDGRTTPGATGR
ncbi:class I SAM-dependent methyltransferase [Kitasatospora sp. NPDC088134]|uniref:class I SAM-dependent methyltransferase n=1 Tax=Kitasatospora sp. NPDC088134 TaxID=3364071 RepID=UPI00381F2F62